MSASTAVVSAVNRALRRGAIVRGAIVDKGVRIAPGARVGVDPEAETDEDDVMTDADDVPITLD